MSARDILAEVISDANEAGSWTCRDLAAAILADPRIAVVELPEVTRTDTYGVKHFHVPGFGIEQDMDLVTLTHRDRDYWKEINADTAQALAAALLAAARKAVES